MKPLAIDLYAGLGGWTEGLIAEGFEVVGFDIERHDYGTGGYPAQLVLQSVLTLHGSQFKDAALIVASPPCQEFSYMAMPWSRAKQIEREYLDGTRHREDLTRLFDACFRIQREAIEAAGHFIPLVVENVRGAQKWVGRSRWNYGSFHLWGDVPALMPMTKKTKGMKPYPDRGWSQGVAISLGLESYNGLKLPGNNGPRLWSEREVQRLCDAGKSFQTASVDAQAGVKQHKSGRAWFADPDTMSGKISSNSPARKAASAAIAKIPFPLARHIANYWKPSEVSQ